MINGKKLLEELKKDINSYNFEVSPELRKKYKIPDTCKDREQIYLSSFNNLLGTTDTALGSYNLSRNYKALIECSKYNDKDLTEKLDNELLNLEVFRETLNPYFNYNLNMVLSHATNTNEITTVPDNTVIVITTPFNKKLNISDSNYFYFKDMVLEELNTKEKINDFLQNPQQLIRKFAISKYGSIYFPGQKINNIELSGNTKGSTRDFFVFNNKNEANKSLIYASKYRTMENVRLRLVELFDIINKKEFNILFLTSCRYCNNKMSNNVISLQYRYDYLNNSINNYFFTNGKEIRYYKVGDDNNDIEEIDSFFVKWNNEEITEYEIGEWHNDVFKVKINDYNKLAYYTLYNKYKFTDIKKIIEKLDNFNLFNYIYYLCVVYFSKINNITNKLDKDKNYQKTTIDPKVFYFNNENQKLIQKINDILKINTNKMSSKLTQTLRLIHSKNFKTNYKPNSLIILKYYLFELLKGFSAGIDIQNMLSIIYLILYKNTKILKEAGINSKDDLPAILEPYYNSKFKSDHLTYFLSHQIRLNSETVKLLKLFKKYSLLTKEQISILAKKELSKPKYKSSENNYLKQIKTILIDV